MSTPQLRKVVVLGGSRKASPVDDEHCYPLSTDEFYVIDDVAKPDGMSNAQATMLSTGISLGIAAIVDFFTADYVLTDAQGKIDISTQNVIITATYSAVSLGCFIGFWLTRRSRNRSVSLYERLASKIKGTLNIS